MPSPYSNTRRRIIFTGVMDYEPNVEAVCWFADKVMPGLRRAGLDLEFVIAGGRPTKQVEALGEAGDITVTGRVEDMRGWLGHADLAVAPLLLARGVQNKVLEAMAAGTPVLTTRPALTGIDAVPGRDVTLCESPDDFVIAIQALLENPEKLEKQADAARNLVHDDYGWGAKIASLTDLIAGANTRRPAQVA